MSRFLLVLLPLFVVTSLLGEEPKPRPKVLLPEQLRDGWIALFDGESTFGWQSPDGSKWAVVRRLLSAEGDKPAQLATTMPFDHYELVVEYHARMPSELLVNAELKDGKLTARSPLKLEPTGLGRGAVKVEVRDGRARRVEATITTDLLGLAGMGTGFKMALDPNEKPRTQPGLIGFRGQGLVLRAVRLRPLGSVELFNGKNLDGWKVFEGKKGKFSVTEQGEISVKDGPGDLATEREFSDFVLQLECKTNGKHLNSGIFFRALPGQYQMGYEAQIQNGWLDKVKTIEVDAFDPKTGEATGKEKLETLAMDFGTGAIYRRVPARMQMADDNDWFHMTVIANGRRIATWVNGIQTVDWVDPRALKENPRQGCRLEKGVLSIQAHDPTTDLLFRNLRVLDQAATKE